MGDMVTIAAAAFTFPGHFLHAHFKLGLHGSKDTYSCYYSCKPDALNV